MGLQGEKARQVCVRKAEAPGWRPEEGLAVLAILTSNMSPSSVGVLLSGCMLMMRAVFCPATVFH